MINTFLLLSVLLNITLLFFLNKKRIDKNKIVIPDKKDYCDMMLKIIKQQREDDGLLDMPQYIEVCPKCESVETVNLNWGGKRCSLCLYTYEKSNQIKLVKWIRKMNKPIKNKIISDGL